jgi:hypothetical protein
MDSPLRFVLHWIALDEHRTAVCEMMVPIGTGVVKAGQEFTEQNKNYEVFCRSVVLKDNP